MLGEKIPLQSRILKVILKKAKREHKLTSGRLFKVPCDHTVRQRVKPCRGES